MANWVRYSRGMGIPFNVGESNSCSCGGQPGVSDSMAAALWSDPPGYQTYKVDT